ncbi:MULTISPECIES: DUF2256 domain-containing protein [unclassified Vibrio]|uniref:DUF2256 domain-containing protein n=1 Tax=unclassified Vibrio TaxID=2614977 RepID=UPI0013614DB5|nr:MULTISPECIES: DUF2256 domain-containing protein [unclassified Vibrio]NAW58786.1 DUF2256 domain-containing protein [Vibrio sp. V36_P2S2PM302]NAX19946.1 DUF2256 domain-containing protein [Vibrio sp. V39_P1S14PM300]NAX25425.1 DUF2256 domain-containing protein [Vibrio sp. V38_P2S17PM301]NAX31045.1 DUF2256 domain-containing protein [Vibrio sp. V37_P2S8PM304]
MAHVKCHLDSKICPVCQRPFYWRRKWQHCWQDVKYCSERCRRTRQKSADKH